MKSIVIRINYKDFKILKGIIKPTKDEPVCYWFYRVRKYIEQEEQDRV